MTSPRSKGAKSTSTKVISTGLAVATGIGVVGLIGVRSSEEASANDAQVSDSVEVAVSDPSVVVSSEGYTQEQLDAYAVALEQEAERLRDYRDQLNAIATQLTNQTVSKKNKKPNIAQPSITQPAPQNSSPQNSSPQKPAAQKPAAKPAPAIQKPQPQSNSQGS